MRRRFEGSFGRDRTRGPQAWRRSLLSLLLIVAGMTLAPEAAQAQTTLFFPAAVPADALSTPLPTARSQAISESAIFVSTGDVLTIAVTGTASGGPGFGFFDANGAPAGSQGTSGPVDDGIFPNIVGPAANIYSLVATIVPPGTDDHLTGVGDEWFLVGTTSSITATRSGELQFALHDALYRADWAPAYKDNQGGFNVTFGVNDSDLDGVVDNSDNCPSTANASQADNDADGLGDACDPDDDNDGRLDAQDNCALTANADQADNDSDGLGDACDPDDDNDTLADTGDNCPTTPNLDQADGDGDGVGDACDEISGVPAGKVTGGGWITATRSNFGFNAQQSASGTSATGMVTYHDKAAGIRIKSTSISSVVISGTHATITGKADLNGVGVDLRIEVDDLGEPGRSDRFEIYAGSYSSGGVLLGGNIQVHG